MVHKGITKKSAQDAAIAHNKKVCIKGISTRTKASLVEELKSKGKTPPSVARAPRKVGGKKPGPKPGAAAAAKAAFRKKMDTMYKVKQTPPSRSKKSTFGTDL
jgi:hypothetical protein